MRPFIPTFQLLLLFCVSFSSAQKKTCVPQQFINPKDWSFVENKGQLTDQDGNLVTDVKFYSHKGGANLYCRPGMISFVFSQTVPETSKENISEATGRTTASEFPISKEAGGFNPIKNRNTQSHKIALNRADLILLNANPAAEIIASNQQTCFENFYLANSPKGGLKNVHTYKTVTYKNIYPHIDMVLHAKPSGLKYEFVVYPGGNVSDIQMQWNGLDKMAMTENGGINYGKKSTKMTETKPVSFQSTPGGAQKNISTSFKIDRHKSTFKVGRYDKSKILVIDPDLVWGTYIGGKNDIYQEAGQTVCTDAKGNVFVGGLTPSGSAIPVTGNAFQDSFAGGDFDAFLAMFDNDGHARWVTYFGGNKDDIIAASATDMFGHVYVGGNTLSTNGIASTNGAQPTFGGDTTKYVYNGFYAKFDTSGKRIWGSYYGGKEPDNIAGMVTDPAGNLYVTGFTTSKGWATGGTHQLFIGGSADAYIAVFDSSGSRQWATYYGGTNYDVGTAITLDKDLNIYVTGWCQSDGMATAKAYQKYNKGGGGDAFLAKFTKTGYLVWGTYLGGTDNDRGFGISVDSRNNVFMTGATGSTSGIATKGAHQTSYGGLDFDAFLAKFDSSGTMAWSTYYGGAGVEFGWGLANDAAGNVYFAGQTQSSANIATKGSFQDTLNGNYGAFLSEFSKDGKLVYGTYLGSNTDGYAMAKDRFGNFFITGDAGGDQGVATPGAFQTTKTGKESAFLMKFRFGPYTDAGIVNILNPTIDFCAAAKTVQVKLENFGLTELDTVQVNWSVNGKAQKPYSWSGKLATNSVVSISLGNYDFIAGTDTLKAWTSNPNATKDSFPDNDSATVVIKVNPLPVINAGKNSTICAGTKDTIGGATQAGYTYAWTSNPKGFTSAKSSNVVSPVKTTTYYLTETVTATGCKSSDSVTIKVNPVPNPHFRVNYTGITTHLFAIDSSLNDSAYIWALGDGDSAMGHRTAHIYPKNKNYLVKLIVTNSFGCRTELDSTVNVPVSGIDDNRLQNPSFEIYPNPFGETFTLRYHLEKETTVRISILDIAGKEAALIINESQLAGAYQAEIGTAGYNLQKGIYTLKCVMNGETFSKRLVKF